MTYNNYLHTLMDFARVSLADTEQADPYNRIEVKYVVPLSLLGKFLPAMSQYYSVLDIDGNRQFGYTTNYFDTPDFRLYKDHHNGYVNRIKVRQRRYEHTGDCFFEIKRKVNDSRTVKCRTPIASLQPQLTTEQSRSIVYPHIAGATPEFKLCNRFSRITLCDPLFTERITIDTDIAMAAGHTEECINGVALIEVKQRQLNRASAAVCFLRAACLHSNPFSKYAIGVSLLFSHIKHNNFKPIISNFRKYESR